MTETPNEPTGETQSSDSISQDDIDAPLGADKTEAAEVESAPAAGPESASQSDIDALSGGGGSESTDGAAPPATEGDPAQDARLDSLGRPFDEAAAAMAAAAEEEKAASQADAKASPSPAPPPRPAGPPLDTQRADLPELAEPGEVRGEVHRVTMLNDVELRVKIELGRTRMLVEDVLGLGEGSVVELDKLAGDPVDVIVNDRLIARGEVLVLNDSFCVRISEVMTDDPHRISV